MIPAESWLESEAERENMSLRIRIQQLCWGHSENIWYVVNHESGM